MALVVHHPPPPDWERQRVRNDDSLVMELRFGDVSMLLTGDIGHDVEQSLLPLFYLRPLVVLKVPHHGCGVLKEKRPYLLTILRAVAGGCDRFVSRSKVLSASAFRCSVGCV